MINDLHVLDELNLGTDGKQIYAKVAEVAQEKKASWQAYAASVYFRVQAAWVSTLCDGDQLPGELKHSLDSTRRIVDDNR